MHIAHTHTRTLISQNFLFVRFLPLFEIRFLFPYVWCVWASSKSPIFFFAFFSLFSLLPPPLHRFIPRRVFRRTTLTAKSTKSTQGRTFDEGHTAGRQPRLFFYDDVGRKFFAWFLSLRDFFSVSVGECLLVFFGVGNVRMFLVTIMREVSNHNCALYLIDSV